MRSAALLVLASFLLVYLVFGSPGATLLVGIALVISGVIVIGASGIFLLDWWRNPETRSLQRLWLRNTPHSCPSCGLVHGGGGAG